MRHGSGSGVHLNSAQARHMRFAPFEFTCRLDPPVCMQAEHLRSFHQKPVRQDANVSLWIPKKQAKLAANGLQG